MKQQTADAIKQYFSDHYEEFLSDFMKLLRAESPSNNKAAGEACAKVLSEIVWDRLAVKPLVYEQEDYAPHLRFTVGSGKRRVLLMGHYDTVWDVGSKPISCENGIVRGPGCFDMKCGLISAIWSLKAAADLQLPMNDLSVDLFFNSDEEPGSTTSNPIYMANIQDYCAAIVLEPSHDGGIKTERKGNGDFRIEITGTAAHAGVDHAKGRSAIGEAARIITYLHSLTNYETGTTLNVGIIEGGTRRNVVAANCAMVVDMRMCTQSVGEEVVRKVYALKPSRDGIGIKISGGINRPAMEKTPQNTALYQKLQSLAADMDIEVHEVSVGGCSDGNFISAAGIATLDGMGAVGAGAHAENEYVDMKKSLERTMLLCGLLSEL